MFLPNCVRICNTVTSGTLFRAPIARHTEWRQRLLVFRTIYCVHWILVSTWYWYCLTSALRSILLITTFFSQNRIGVPGDALCWLASYLTDRTQCVNVDGHLSCNIQLRHGVPQGSVLGLLLFSVYCAGLSEVFSKHRIRYHVYADDTQLYVDFPRNDAASAVDRITRCVIDVKVWLASRYLLLNETKTEAVLFSAPNNRVPQPPPLLIDICGCNVSTSANTRDLGVQLDSMMSMAAHVSRTCRTAYAQLLGIA